MKVKFSWYGRPMIWNNEDAVGVRFMVVNYFGSKTTRITFNIY